MIGFHFLADPSGCYEEEGWLGVSGSTWRPVRSQAGGEVAVSGTVEGAEDMKSDRGGEWCGSAKSGPPAKCRLSGSPREAPTVPGFPVTDRCIGVARLPAGGREQAVDPGAWQCGP